MNDNEIGENISICANERFYFIFVFSVYHYLVWDNQTPIYCLEKETSDESLGKLVSFSFNQCRVINPYEDDFFYNKERMEKDYKKCINELLAKYQFKNKKALFLRMMTCSLRRNHGEILIKPMLHKKLELWTRDGFTDDDNIILPQTASNEELGKAVKEGMSRCRNSV